MSHADAEEWYWDLRRNKAVRADERGPGDDTLGPYPSKFEAENWKARVEERNEEWQGADDEWEHGDRDDGESGDD